MSPSHLPARVAEEYDQPRRLSYAQSSPRSWNDSLDLSSTISNATSEYQYEGASRPTGNHPHLESVGSTVLRVKSKNGKEPRNGYLNTTEYFYEEVDKSWTEIMLIVCCIVSGILNVVAYQVMGIFYGMQTGSVSLSSPQWSL